MKSRTLRRATIALVAAGVTTGTALGVPAGAALASQPADGQQQTQQQAQQPAPRTAVASASAAEKRLGADAAGTYLDRSTGDMVVNITDPAAAAKVRAAGATPKVVEHSTADLRKVTTTMRRSTSVPGTAWAIDPTSNSVVVTLDQSVDRRERATIGAATRRFGDQVTIKRVAGTFSTTIAGGQAILGSSGGRCSLGFNVRSSSGTRYFLTAGHCTNSISSWRTSGGSYLGPTISSSFPGNDYGVVRHDNSLAKPGSVHLYSGSQDITRAANAFVGQYVRRSGSTTGLHDGYVQALNATVRYPEGTVYGLIQTNVCAEPGDSGGSLFAGTAALGLTSGGSGNCTTGGTTFFQPVIEALNAYGVSVY